MQKFAADNQESDMPNLRGGRFAPHWFYFLFYLYCRRQKKLSEKNTKFDPTFSAWSGMGALVAMPWLVLILTIDHYFPFLHTLGNLWIMLHLPGAHDKAWGYACMIIAIATLIGIFVFLFGWRYEKIMHEFSAYNRSEHIFAPGMLLLLVGIMMIVVAGSAAVLIASGNQSALLPATLTNIGIFIVTEVVFRRWWHSWCRTNDGHQGDVGN